MEKIDYRGALLESHIEWPDSSRHFVPVADDKKSDKKLAKCLKSYEVKDEEEVLFILDDTVFGSATDGILFTERAIYVKQLGDSPERIAYFQIRDASVYTEGKHDNIHMEINGETFGPFGMLDDDFLEPLEAALVHIRIATNQKINEVQEVVESKKAEREQAAGEDSNTCSSCNAANEKGAKFCSSCGTKLDTQVFCTACGEKLAAGAKFCGNCGTQAGGSGREASTTAEDGSKTTDAIELTHDAIQETTGNIDSDGDFRADVTLSTEGCGNEGEKIFIKSRVTAELNGEKTDVDEGAIDYCVGDQMYLSSAYKKIDARDGDQFSVDISLDVFKKSSSKQATFTTDDCSTHVDIGAASLQILSVEIDGDGDAVVRYELTSKAQQIIGIAIGPEGEELSASFMEYHEDEFEDSTYVMGVSDGDTLRVELTLMTLHSQGIALSAQGNVTVSEESGEDEDEWNEDNDNDHDATEGPLVGLLERFNEEWQEVFAKHVEHYQNNILSTYTDRHEEIRIDISLQPTAYSHWPENIKEDPNLFYLRIQLRLEEYETDNPISWQEAGISNEYAWEELSDAVTEDLNHYASQGHKSSEFPEELKASLEDDEPYSFYGSAVIWNDEDVVY